jgi:hypothetical protein
MLDLLSDRGLPLSQTVLHRRKFRELTLPVRKHAKRFGIAILCLISLLYSSSAQLFAAHLVEFTIKAADELTEILVELFQHSLARLVPEPWIFALFLVIVLEGKIQVRNVRFPEDFVFGLLEGSGLVWVSVETYQIGHAGFM